jgi:glycosyltransferase involved in cell wall biosynthesis
MRICLVCIELFGYGTTGGFGRATRMIGWELARRGHQITIITRRSPWSAETRDDFLLDGMRVRLYPPRRPWESMALYRAARADIYHSQDPSLGTLLAMLAMPAAKHVVTLRAPVVREDIAIDRRHGEWGFRGQLMHFIQADNPLIRAAVRRTPHVYAAAHCIADKAARHFGIPPPRFLPTPIVIPPAVEKASRPTVCFVGRWHGIKQPEHFLALARRLPDIRFIAVGGAPEQSRDAELRRLYAGFPNLEMTGVIDQFQSSRLSEILGKSWVLVNTSLREALPTTFLEAAAHRCAILSYLDPEGFASRFGYHAHAGDLEQGLAHLLAEDRWRRLGEAAYRQVNSLYAADAAIDRHIEAYRQVLAQRS